MQTKTGWKLAANPDQAGEHEHLGHRHIDISTTPYAYAQLLHTGARTVHSAFCKICY
jgi:hypothetical protein